MFFINTFVVLLATVAAAPQGYPPSVPQHDQGGASRGFQDPLHFGDGQQFQGSNVGLQQSQQYAEPNNAFEGIPNTNGFGHEGIEEQDSLFVDPTNLGNNLLTDAEYFDEISQTFETEPCSNGHVLDINGQCAEPEINRNLYFYSSPANPRSSSSRSLPAPKPKLNYNVVFVKISDDEDGGQKPVVVPPPQQKTVVYVLSKDSTNGSDHVIEVPEGPQHPPDVYYVNYVEGENPQLPIGIDLRSALELAESEDGRALELDSNVFLSGVASEAQAGEFGIEQDFERPANLFDHERDAFSHHGNEGSRGLQENFSSTGFGGSVFVDSQQDNGNNNNNVGNPIFRHPESVGFSHSNGNNGVQVNRNALGSNGPFNQIYNGELSGTREQSGLNGQRGVSFQSHQGEENFNSLQSENTRVNNQGGQGFTNQVDHSFGNQGDHIFNEGGHNFNNQGDHRLNDQGGHSFNEGGHNFNDQGDHTGYNGKQENEQLSNGSVGNGRDNGNVDNGQFNFQRGNGHFNGLDNGQFSIKGENGGSSQILNGVFHGHRSLDQFEEQRHEAEGQRGVNGPELRQQFNQGGNPADLATLNREYSQPQSSSQQPQPQRSLSQSQPQHSSPQSQPQRSLSQSQPQLPSQQSQPQFTQQLQSQGQQRQAPATAYNTPTNN